MHSTDPQPTYLRFLSRWAMLERDLTIGGVSVCPPVRLSHTDIDSKLITERVIAVAVPATALSIEE